MYIKMKTVAILTIIACSISFASSFPDERKNRMFSLFNVVKFKNSACQATSSTDLQGICHTSEECDDNGGSADGNCAASFGVCCVIKIAPGATATQNGSFLESTGFPTAVTATGASAYTITRCSSDICQVRLDFVNTILAQPTSTTGACVDTLTIAAGAGDGTQPGTVTPPILCGTLTGQHLYIDAGTANTAATVTFNVGTASTQAWRVKVSQIECFSEWKAPAGCLQYFSGSPRHTVTSFNFDGTTCVTGCMIRSQDYRVCFRQEEGMCGTQYTESTLANAANDAFLLTNAATTALITMANCPSALLQITNVVPDTPAAQDTFCGSNLNNSNTANSQALITAGAPFGFRVVARSAGGTPVDLNALPGFSVDATQIPCPVVST